MAKIQLPISNGFYVSDALPISNQQCVNFYPNVPQADTVTQDNLFGTPGIEEVIDLSDLDAICRGSLVMSQSPYYVIGDKLWRVNRSVVDGVESFSADDLGFVAGSSRVYMATSGAQLCIVAPPDDDTPGESYIYDLVEGTFSEIVDENFDGPASSVVYIDGLFVFSKHEAKKFFNSPIQDGRGLPDGAAYDALDFSIPTNNTTVTRGLIEHKGLLYVFGGERAQIFRNTGRSPAPFVSANAELDVGLFAPQTLILFGGSVAFVGGGVNESPAVWLVTGSSRQKISTTAIDNELSRVAGLSATEASDVFSWVYAESGAYFLGITLPDTTFVFDQINQRWHERKSIMGAEVTQCRAASMVTAFGRVLVGDLQSGKIGHLDEDSRTEYGFVMRRFVTSKPFDNLGNSLRVASLEAVVESGVGLVNDVVVGSGTTELGIITTVQGGKDPKITLSWSDDGGYNFVGDRSRSMGKIGEYKARPIWTRLGRFPRSRVIKLEVTSPTKATIIKVEADIG